MITNISEILQINGSIGEGGGQVLRSALTLSLCLQQPFHISHIRATRKRPGLQPQHLMAVKAAATIGYAEVYGATLGSSELTFIPHGIQSGEFHLDIGTAGSTNLVLQTILPPLLTANLPSTIYLKGGTHNPLAPSFDFLQLAFLPLIKRMGPVVHMKLHRLGFYPVGGGMIEVHINPVKILKPLSLIKRGKIIDLRAWSVVSHLPKHIAQRELDVIANTLHLSEHQLELRHANALGPGNAVTLLIESEELTEVFVGIGERGVRAETVAERVITEAKEYLKANVPVGKHLADQLLLLLALSGGGEFITMPPSRHTTTNIAVISIFTGLQIQCKELAADQWSIHC